tara:strand:+ start:8629 stop:9042 length:414 start_codon:yes stop_codon:yes gene_type:complete
MDKNNLPRIVSLTSIMIQFLIVYIFLSNLVLVLSGHIPMVAEYASVGSGPYMVFLLCWCFFLLLLVELFNRRMKSIRNLFVSLAIFHVYIYISSFFHTEIDIKSLSFAFSSLQVLIESVLLVMIYSPESRCWFNKKS